MSSISIPTMNGASFRSLSLSSARRRNTNACSFSNDALLKKRGRKSFARSKSTSSSRDGVVVTHASSSPSSFAKSKTLFWPGSRRQGRGRRTMTTTAIIRTTETTKTEAIGRNESRRSSNSRSRSSSSSRRIRRNKAIFDSRDEDKESATKAAATAAAVDSSPENQGNRNSSSASSPTELLKTLGAKDIVDASRDSIDDERDETNSKTTLVAFGCVLLGILASSVYFREPITEALFGYASYLDSLGPVNGPLLFGFGYFVLEMFAVPAFPLTMSAGALFGAFEGTLVVVSSATVAAVAAFLVSRYVARDSVKKLASEKFGEQYRKIDEAIGENGFGVVFMLRLSPLLPFSVSNYLYGLTSVSVLEYAPASFLGMIPGTAAYVASGDVARTISAGGGATVQQIGPALLALGLSALSAWYVGKIASNALCEDDENFCDTDTSATSFDKEEKK
ncbi:unnamed protein product [Bathycoccus prasinos]